MPDIDEICRMLDCTPGEAPGVVAEMLERSRWHPGDEPPDDERDVFTLRGRFLGAGYYSSEHAEWRYYHPNSHLRDEVDYWREVSLLPEG